MITDQQLTTEKIDTYLVLDDLPSPPEHFIKEALGIVYAEQKTRPLPIKSSVYASRRVFRDGQEMKPIFSRRYELSEEFRNWIKEHIVDRFREVSVCCTPPGESGWQAAHTDWSRDFLLLFVLAKGGPECRTCWYDVPDPTVIKTDTTWKRRRKPQTWVERYEDLELRDWVTMPLNKWTVINVTTMHGVENITEDRVAIHVGLDDIALIKSDLI
jgi:hypothetical protein